MSTLGSLAGLLSRDGVALAKDSDDMVWREVERSKAGG